jgi:hypothetical protein
VFDRAALLNYKPVRVQGFVSLLFAFLSQILNRDLLLAYSYIKGRRNYDF